MLSHQLQMAVAALTPAEQISDSAQLQIDLSQVKAIIRFFYRGQALFGDAEVFASDSPGLMVANTINAYVLGIVGD